MRRLAVLALGAVLAVPAVAVAQEPSQVPSGELHLCVTAQVENGVDLAPIPLTQAIAEGRVLISDVVLCDPPAAPGATTSPPTLFGTPEPEPAVAEGDPLPLEIAGSGFTAYRGSTPYTDWAVVVTNPNPTTWAGTASVD